MAKKDTSPSKSQKDYLSDRLHELFSQAQQTLTDRASVRRMEVEMKVREKAGVGAAEKAAQKLEEQANELNRQYSEITGMSLVSIQVTPLSKRSGLGGILARQVDEALGETKEGQIIQQMAAYRRTLLDRIHLSSGELDLASMLIEAQIKIDEYVNSGKKLLTK